MAVVLGIESSCDETGVGLVADGVLLGEALASSVDEHVRFGGVIPEIAARAHLEALGPTVEVALSRAGLDLDAVDAVAVTAGPGLATAVQVGLAAAKAYAWALGRPLYGVHHLAGHVAADVLEHGPLPDRCVALVVSGGHTSLLALGDLARDPIHHLGDTVDDAAGEAFDKVARVLGLPYPGGPAIDRLARTGNAAAVPFPRPLLHDRAQPYAFSFSGLKTAVARRVADNAGAHEPGGTSTEAADGGTDEVADLAASFQEAVVDVLTAKAVRACADQGVDTLVVAGGVAANGRLRELAEQRCAAAGITLRVPRPSLCTDNGAMIAAVGDLLVRAGRRPDDLSLAADPSAVLTQAALVG